VGGCHERLKRQVSIEVDRVDRRERKSTRAKHALEVGDTKAGKLAGTEVANAAAAAPDDLIPTIVPPPLLLLLGILSPNNGNLPSGNKSASGKAGDEVRGDVAKLPESSSSSSMLNALSAFPPSPSSPPSTPLSTARAAAASATISRGNCTFTLNEPFQTFSTRLLQC
jgi:hypothetical protein